MAVAYGSQGAGAAVTVSATGLSVPCPAAVAANDILIAHVSYRDTTSTFSTPADWSLLAGPQSAGTTGRHWVYGKLAVGDEDGASIAFGGTGTTVTRMGRIYSFTGYVSGTLGQLVVGFDHATAGTAAIPDVGVQTDVAGALAVNLVYVTDDNAVAAATGMIGGTWAENVAQFTTTLGSDGCLQIQTAPMANAGGIDGGSQTMAAADPWGVYGFQIRPSFPPPEPPDVTLPGVAP